MHTKHAFRKHNAWLLTSSTSDNRCALDLCPWAFIARKPGSDPEARNLCSCYLNQTSPNLTIKVQNTPVISGRINLSVSTWDVINYQMTTCKKTYKMTECITIPIITYSFVPVHSAWSTQPRLIHVSDSKIKQEQHSLCYTLREISLKETFTRAYSTRWTFCPALQFQVESSCFEQQMWTEHRGGKTITGKTPFLQPPFINKPKNYLNQDRSQ